MQGKKTPPIVDKEACTGCAACVAVCPSFVLELRDDRASVVRGDWCIGCGHCGAVCPTRAVIQPETAVPDDCVPGERPSVSPENLQMLFRERRSARLYLREAIPRETLERIIEAGRYAPTGTNSQNVHHIILTSQHEIDALRGMILRFYERLFKRARHPVGALLISILAGRKTLDYLRGYLPMIRFARDALDRGMDPLLHHAPAIMMTHAESWDPCSAFNCAVALYSCSLMAHSQGLGCCFNGFVEGALNHDRRIKTWMGIPRDHRCYGAMTLGFSKVQFRRLVERRVPRVRWR